MLVSVVKSPEAPGAGMGAGRLLHLPPACLPSHVTALHTHRRGAWMCKASESVHVSEGVPPPLLTTASSSPTLPMLTPTFAPWHTPLVEQSERHGGTHQQLQVSLQQMGWWSCRS